jgi:hypothetical protein
MQRKQPDPCAGQMGPDHPGKTNENQGMFSRHYPEFWQLSCSRRKYSSLRLSEVMRPRTATPALTRFGFS